MTKATPFKDDVADKLRELRSALGLSQDKFASWFGVTKTTVSNWETKSRQPSGEHYIKMGNLSPDAELALYFYRRAGIDLQRMKRALTATTGRKSHYR